MSKPNNTEVNLDALKEPLNKICTACDYNDTTECNEPACLIGFARKVLEFAAHKGVLDIPGAADLMPKDDFKPYYPENVAPALAETCKQCRECRENHSDDCIIALVRNCLENTILQENIPYPGSVFMYLAKIKEQSSEVAALIAEQLQKK